MDALVPLDDEMSTVRLFSRYGVGPEERLDLPAFNKAFCSAFGVYTASMYQLWHLLDKHASGAIPAYHFFTLVDLYRARIEGHQVVY
ncbi:MAG: hypothetical protein V2I33_24110 [Kangiellaceae bacterium]|nr:hypothetical protein [Kangiellaceae bacterium]